LLTDVEGAMLMSPLEHAASSVLAAITVSIGLRFILYSPEYFFAFTT
jgi:hypothetical protein